MRKVQDQSYLLTEQYKNQDNLRARINLHERFSTNKTDFSTWILSHIKQNHNEEKLSLLELGTGPANFWVKTKALVPKAWQLSLSDLSIGMIEAAKEATKDFTNQIDYQVIDAQSIPFEDNSFDIIMANHMLYHVPNIDKAISEIRRVLKPDGRFYAATNGNEHLKELDSFIVEQLASKLPECEFELMRGLAFRLENGKGIINKHFQTIYLHTFKCDLSVTEAEPFMAYILSMQRFQSLIETTSQVKLERVLNEARVLLEDMLKKGAIHVTKATGLFEAH
jgi:ubiquinone/menaquinone biosynthesis C-methylase UbiE